MASLFTAIRITQFTFGIDLEFEVKLGGKTLHTNMFCRRLQRQKPMLVKKGIDAHLKFAKQYLDDSPTAGVMFCGQMSQKWKFLDYVGIIIFEENQTQNIPQ